MRFVTGFKQYHNRRSRRYKHHLQPEHLNIDYHWKLSRFLEDTHELHPSYAPPMKDLGNGLTVEKIIATMIDQTHHFEFDYTPQERDELVVWKHFIVPVKYNPYHYMLLEYRNGSWIDTWPNEFVFTLLGTGHIAL